MRADHSLDLVIGQTWIVLTFGMLWSAETNWKRKRSNLRRSNELVESRMIFLPIKKAGSSRHINLPGISQGSCVDGLVFSKRA